MKQILVIESTTGTLFNEFDTTAQAMKALKTAPTGKYDVLKRHRVGIEVAEKPITATVSSGHGFVTRTRKDKKSKK